MTSYESFSFDRDGIDFTVHVVCYESFDGFSDQWEMSDDHKGGVTISNKSADRNSYKYGIPQQTSLAELTAQYAKQGRENPSREAYDSLQNQLERDINASDYGFQVSATVDGVDLLIGESIGCGFDYSYQDEDDLEDAAKEVFFGNGCDVEALEAAKKAAQEILNKVDSLKKIA